MDENKVQAAKETSVLSACNLAHLPRWIPLDNLGHRYYRHMCSNCGAITNRKQLPDICGECKSIMKGNKNNG